MITVEPTNDVDFIHSVMSHPAIFPKITDDGVAILDKAAVVYIVEQRPEFTFIRVRDIGDDVGLFMFHKHGTAMYEVHTCILPEYRGPKAYEAAKAAAQWLWDHTQAGVITTLIPESDKAVTRFAKRIGFRAVGVIPSSLLRGQKYLNQILLTLERSCQQSSQ